MSNYKNTAMMKDMGMTKEEINLHYRNEQRRNAYDTHGQSKKNSSKKKSVGAKRRQMEDDSAAFERMLRSGNYDDFDF